MSKWGAVVSYRDQKSLFWFVRFVSMTDVDDAIHEYSMIELYFFHDAIMQPNAGCFILGFVVSNGF